MSTCERKIASLTKSISQKLGDLHQSTAETATKLQSLAKEAGATELEKLSSHSQAISEQLDHVQKALDSIQENNGTETEALQAAQSTLGEMQTTLKNKFVSWGASLTSTYSSLCDDLQQWSQEGMTAVEKALGDVHSVLDTVLHEAQQYIKDVLASLEQSRQLANDATQAEVVHLRQQNENLIQMLKNEKIKADMAKEMLLHRMSEMLDVFMNEQYSRLEVNIKGLRDSNVKAQDNLESYLQQQGGLADRIAGSGKSLRTTLQGQGGSAKRTRDGAFKVS